jgi:vacuolar protein sorting-associated protein 54
VRSLLYYSTRCSRSFEYRLLTDAHYLHEKFSVLKTAGAPTALLETLVGDKRVGNAPISPRPTTPTPVPSSLLPLPPSNVPLGSSRAAVPPPPAKRPSLFSNERLKGMLSRSTTTQQPPVPAPIPVPAPVTPHEKQGGEGGGFKQVLSPLSPTPLPVEKQQRELPTTPTPLPIQATPSPTPAWTEEDRQERDGAERQNGDVSSRDGPSAGVEGVSQGQGHGDGFGQPPPTPAKDDVVEMSQMAVLDPAPESASVVTT